MNPPTFYETCEAIADGRFAHWEKDVQEKVLLTTHADGWTPLHAAARDGNLHKIPEAILTEEVLLTPILNGITALHTAAWHSHLDQIPKELLTEQMLLTPHKEGWTPLHYAVWKADFSHIPKEVLTEKNLLVPTNDGQTSLDMAAGNGHLDQIPIELRLSTLKDLLEQEHINKKSRKWIEREIQSRRKEEVKKSLENCKHPDL